MKKSCDFDKMHKVRDMELCKNTPWLDATIVKIKKTGFDVKRI